MEGNIFLQISALLAITVTMAFFIRLLKQPLIIAYIIAGITAGPMFFNLLHADIGMYEAFAQFGVVLLLFIIGLNLNFSQLRTIGKNSVITGLGQVAFTSIIGVAILLLLGIDFYTSVYLAIAITFSSTIIIMKMLADKKDTNTVYGKHTIGLMLVQDVIAVLIMIIIGILKGGHELGGSLFFLFLKGIAILALIYLISKHLLPKLLNRISHSSELLFLFTVSWCFAIASLLYISGFSIEIGAIIAGISLSSSPYQPEIASRMKPLRDFFLIIFFIVLGSEMSIASIGSIWLPGLILSLFILVGNPLILYLLFRKLKFTRRNSFLAGVTAAQVSEFGFVILFTGNQIGHLGGSEVPIFTIVAIVTIFTSSYLIIYGEKIYNFILPFLNLFGPDKYRQIEGKIIAYDIWVVGYHRIGKTVCRALKDMKSKFSVIDFNPGAIMELKKEKIHSVFGDIADVEFLESLSVASSKLVVMTIPAVKDQINLINHVRKLNPKILIIANASQFKDVGVLYEAGVNYVMMPHLLGADWIAGVLKKNKRLTRKFFADLKSEQISEVSAVCDIA